MYLNPTEQLGGAERVLLDLLPSLRAAQPGWSSTRLIVASEGPLAERALTLCVPTNCFAVSATHRTAGRFWDREPSCLAAAAIHSIVKLALAIVAAAGYARGVRGVLERMAPDLLHTNGVKMHALGK